MGFICPAYEVVIGVTQLKRNRNLNSKLQTLKLGAGHQFISYKHCVVLEGCPEMASEDSRQELT